MAEPLTVFKQKLEDQVTCVVCLDQYTNPKTLPCLHSFCLECIWRFRFDRKDGKDYLSCPVCRVEHPLPEGGPGKFPNAFQLNNLLEMKNDLAKKETHLTSTSSKELQETPTVGNKASTCPLHNDPLRVYCETCDRLICTVCAISNEHKKHKYNLIVECYPKHHQQREGELRQVKSKIIDIDQAIMDLTNEEMRVDEQGERLTMEIHQHAQQLSDVLEPDKPVRTQSKATDHSQITKLYEENVRNNKRTLRLRALKGVLIGGPGVGKTITFKRLIGERSNIKIDGDSASSSGIESPNPVYHAHVSKTSVLIPAEGSWSSKSVEDEFYTCLLQCDRQHSQPLDSAESATSVPLARDQNASTRLISFHESESIQLNKHNAPSASASAPSAPSTSASAPPRIDLNKIQTLLNEQKYKEIEKVLEEVNELTVLYMIDLGGQPEFFEMVPLILRGPSLNLIFVNLSLSLTEQFEVNYRHTPTDCSTITYTSSYSQLQMIHQVLATIASLNESEHSIVESLATDTDLASAFLIGTHFDKICRSSNRQGKVVMDFEEEVKCSLKHTMLYDVLKKLQNKEERSFIFPINNYNGDDEEILLLQKALTQQISYRFRPIELPMSWGIFHLLLRKEYEHVGLCSLQEALALGMSCSIGSEAEVKIVLKFFHLFFGTILHYHDVDALKDRVICDPNLIFKPLSQIIAEAFGAIPNDEQIVERMRNTGEIPQPVLNRALHVKDEILSMSDVVELLKHHNVLRTMKNADGKECLFMPCLLKPDDKLVSKASNSLLFSFKPHRFQPVGLFYVLIAKLVELEQFKIDNVRFRNKVGFFYGNTHVEIQSTVTHIEVLVDEYTYQRCVRLHNILRYEIESIMHELPHMRSTKLEICFYCPEALDGSPHIAPLSDPNHLLESEQPKLLCSQCGNRAIQLTEEQEMWLKKCKPTTGTNQMDLEMPFSKNHLVLNDEDSDYVPFTDSSYIKSNQCCSPVVNPLPHTKSFAGYTKQYGKQSCITKSGATAMPKPSIPTSSCTMEIKEKTVFKLLKHHSHRWSDLGRELEVPLNFRHELRTSEQSDADRLEHIIHKWFESQCTPVTWSTFRDTLKELELMNIVQDLEQYLNQ